MAISIERESSERYEGDDAVKAASDPTLHKDGFPSPGDLRRMFHEQPIPVIESEIITLVASLVSDQAAIERASTVVLENFNAALAADDTDGLQDCFFAEQAYWKDTLALTYHLRTFLSPGIIATNLLQTKKLRNIEQGWKFDGARFIPASSTLQFIDVSLSFETTSPKASCSGRLLLLPTKNQSGGLEWKIWILSTSLDNLDVHSEDASLLKSRGKIPDMPEVVETDVSIIGGGNAAAALSARLKAFGVDSVMVERNAHVGDNWALRYDCLKFHVPTSFCDLPYFPYDEDLRASHLLTRDELAEQLRRYVSAFDLNLITSAQITSTVYDKRAQRWTMKCRVPGGERTIISKHVVQATGVGSQAPYVPSINDKGRYQGISIHSYSFKSGKALKEQGAKSVLIIGSANTAFDVLEDCHAAGLQVTMNVRSPTYMCPVDYVCDKRALGMYDFSVEAADRMMLTLPTAVDGQLGRNLFAMFASQEPERYAALAAAGFPVLDSTDPDQALFYNLLESCGGHYTDIGGTRFIAEGEVGLKALVEPVAYTATGLRFSDDSVADADAIVWCTGYADKDVRAVTAAILGGDDDNGTSNEGTGGNDGDLSGPSDIAARLDTTWGVDAEGEIRGMWKRHYRLDNYWVMGGHAQQHRWHSRTLALQIKAALEGILPPAYRDTLSP